LNGTEGKVSRTLIASLLLTASAAWCATDEMRGPVSGLLVDTQTRAIRPIVGIPGSAYAGETAVREADFALAAPNGQTALVTRESSLYVLRRADSDQPVWRILGENAGTIGRAAWSEDAKALALYFPAESRLQLWAGMQEAPEITAEIDLSAAEGRLKSLAVTSDGTTAFAVIENGESGALYILKTGESPRILLALNRAGSLVLSGKSLYVADLERNEIVRLEDWDSGLSVTTVATAAHGVASPVGIALASGGELLLVANGETRQVVAVHTTRLTVEAVVDLDFMPTSLEPTGSVFLLASGTAGESPAQVLDASTMKVYFVPVPALPPPAAVE